LESARTCPYDGYFSGKTDQASGLPHRANATIRSPASLGAASLTVLS